MHLLSGDQFDWEDDLDICFDNPQNHGSIPNESAES